MIVGWMVAAAGVGAGLAATGATTLYQAAMAPLFGQGQSDDDPANVKAADSADEAVTGRPVPKPWRQQAGSLVHYATGVALGLIYAFAVSQWPPAAWAFGAAYGVVVMLVLDELLVPTFAWGPWPWATPAATHAYSLTTHLVFGVVLEAARRGVLALLA